jgi:hypothetical protein
MPMTTDDILVMSQISRRPDDFVTNVIDIFLYLFVS